MASSHSRRRAPLGTLALLIPLLPLTACGSSDDDDDGGGTVPGAQAGFSALLDEAQEVPTPQSGTRFRVSVTNMAPDMGTFQTPVWLGFHDGTFDIYDLGAAADAFFPATNALERLAEDGDTDPLDDAFDDADAGVMRAVLEGQLGPMVGPIAPGETVSMVFELDPADPENRYMSYASMVIPSNDAFVANGNPMAVEVFDTGGSFVASAFTVSGGVVRDAGTEVNDETPANTAFFGQTTDDTGTDELGVVMTHAGFLAPGAGGILDDPMFAEADFTEAGYQTLAFDFEELPADPPAMGVATVRLINGGAQVTYTVSATGLSGPVTGAHFHEGVLGVAGPVLIGITDSILENQNGSVLIEGTKATTNDFLAALEAGDVYINLHTPLNPPGEVRGQVTAEESFFGPLSTAQEVPSPTLGSEVRVTLRNVSPADGTFLSPVWVGFHDGTFDTYEVGSSAMSSFPSTNALERLAEDGATDPFVDAFESKGGSALQGVLGGTLEPGPLRPGETVSGTFRLDPTGTSRFLSYATMVLPSNDAFLANDDPMAHEVFGAGGAFTGMDFTVGGGAALDAGTEVNDELPANTAFFGQTTDDTGTPQGGVVALHPGFMAAGMGGILDDPMFAGADFTQPGYEFLHVSLAEGTTSIAPSGVVAARLNDTEDMITFSVSAMELTGPVTGMHFHEGAPGVPGPILVSLTSFITVNGDGELFASGATAVDADFVEALRAGEVYLNVHTALNPAGELRGQLVQFN